MQWTSPERWKGRRVLVTGASGFLGRAVCDVLCTAGASVHGTGRTRPVPAGVLAHRAELPTDARQIIASSRPSVVINLASPVDLRREPTLYDTLRPGILDATVALSQACLQASARLVQVGSCEELAGGTVPFSPDAPPRPTSPYSALKAAASLWVMQLHRSAGLDAVVVRPFRSIGPGEIRGLVATSCRSALRKQALRLTDGAQVREWNDVRAIARGLVGIAAHPDATGRCFNLGGGPRRSVRELVHQIYREAGADPALLEFDALPRRAAEVDAFWGDHSATRALLGSLPLTDLVDTLKRTLAWHAQDPEVSP